jgi:hypothetical protein
MEGMFSRALLEAREAHKTLEEEKATRDAEARPVMVSDSAVILDIVPFMNSLKDNGYYVSHLLFH